MKNISQTKWLLSLLLVGSIFATEQTKQYSLLYYRGAESSNQPFLRIFEVTNANDPSKDLRKALIKHAKEENTRKDISGYFHAPAYVNSGAEVIDIEGFEIHNTEIYSVPTFKNVKLFTFSTDTIKQLKNGKTTLTNNGKNFNLINSYDFMKSNENNRASNAIKAAITEFELIQQANNYYLKFNESFNNDYKEVEDSKVIDLSSNVQNIQGDTKLIMKDLVKEGIRKLRLLKVFRNKNIKLFISMDLYHQIFLNDFMNTKNLLPLSAKLIVLENKTETEEVELKKRGMIEITDKDFDIKKKDENKDENKDSKAKKIGGMDILYAILLVVAGITIEALTRLSEKIIENDAKSQVHFDNATWDDYDNWDDEL